MRSARENHTAHSTTHMSRSCCRALEGGAGGGCPVLVFGITRKLYVENVCSTASPWIEFPKNHRPVSERFWLTHRGYSPTGPARWLPEHKRLFRYQTMTNEEIIALPVKELALPQSHLYLWGTECAGFHRPASDGGRGALPIRPTWCGTKSRKDGGPDRRGSVSTSAMSLSWCSSGCGGSLRTLQPGRRMPNIIISQKREHSRKPDEQYQIIEECSPGPYLELFARHPAPRLDAVGQRD